MIMAHKKDSISTLANVILSTDNRKTFFILLHVPLCYVSSSSVYVPGVASVKWSRGECPLSTVYTVQCPVKVLS